MNDKVEPTVAKEVAEAEFDRFVDAMDLDLDTADMDAEDLTAFNKQKRRILNAMQAGSLLINDKGEAVYAPQNPKSKYKEAITFHERTGASLMATDGKKKNQDAAKTYAMIADITGLHPGVYAGLVGIDIKVCEALFALLME